MVKRFVRDLDVVLAEAAFLVCERTFHQRDQIVRRQWLQSKNLRARNKRAVYIKEWVISRRADQPQVSALDVRQQNILLRFVEMMDLVDKDDGFFAGRAETIGGRRNHAPHFRDVAFPTTYPHKFRLR